MIVDSLHPMNRAVLAYLGRGAKSHCQPLGAPDSVADAYRTYEEIMRERGAAGIRPRFPG
jgi:hypothetical protein